MILILFLAFRLPDLGYDLSNSDATRWHRRSINFLDALKKGELRNTYQHYQPGVTLMWMNAVIMQVTHNYPYLENSQIFPIIHRNTKIAIVFVLALLLIVQVWTVNKIFGRETSLFYMLLVSVEPYLIGIDRWVHLTSLETYFGFTSFLLLLLWIKEKRLFLLILSSIFLSLGVLSKLTTFSLLPLFLFLILLNNYTLTEKSAEGKFKISFKKGSLLKSIKEPVLFLGTFIIPAVILLPALWVDPVHVISEMYKSVRSAVTDGILVRYFTGALYYLYYFIILGFKLSPITLILSLAGLILAIRARKKELFVVLYFGYLFLILTLSDKKIDRYAIIMFPPLLLLASAAVSEMSKRIKIAVIALSAALIIFATYIYYPIYSGYYSPIFGGVRSAINLGVYDNSGEYFANAAFYLNRKGRNLSIYIPENHESFVYYSWNKYQSTPDSFTDYEIQSLDFDRPSPIQEKCMELEQKFGPRGADVLFLYKCD